jgi:DNA-binding MarR family transcriptional regulator
MKINILELGRAIKQLQNHNHRRLEFGLREIDITLAQWDALRAIQNIPGGSAHALAEETFQTDQSFGTLATRLIAKGLVERQQGVGRALVHTLTEQGERILKRGLAIAAPLVDESFRALSEPERAQLFALVQKVLKNEPVEAA